MMRSTTIAHVLHNTIEDSSMLLAGASARQRRQGQGPSACKSRPWAAAHIVILNIKAMGRRTYRHLEDQGHGPPYISSSITSKPYLNRSKSKVLPRGSLELLLRLVDGPLLPTPAMGADDTLPSQSGGGGFRGCPPTDSYWQRFADWRLFGRGGWLPGCT